MKQEINEQAFCLMSLASGTHWSVTPHVSETRTEQAVLRELARPRLVDGKFAGGDIFTTRSTEQRASNDLGGGSGGWVEHACRR